MIVSLIRENIFLHNLQPTLTQFMKVYGSLKNFFQCLIILLFKTDASLESWNWLYNHMTWSW